MNSTIFYFTGSGNSLKVAKDIANKLQGAELVQICKANMERYKETLSGTVGFVFPVYCAGLPFMVLDFAEKLKLDKDAYVFAVSTQGGVPGISHKQLEDVLAVRGIKLSAVFGIPMPGNYQVMYPPQSSESQQKRFAAQKELVNKIVESVNTKEVIKVEAAKGLMKAFCNMMYKKFIPYDRDKNFWVDEKCNGCGTCSKVCPADNIVISGGKPEWKHQCEHCLACMHWCPKQSLQYKKVTVKRGRYQHPEIKVQEMFHK